jgi:hypothetical protein
MLVSLLFSLIGHHEISCDVKAPEISCDVKAPEISCDVKERGLELVETSRFQLAQL